MSEQTDILVFLSYASEDREHVLPVYEFLVKNGFPNVWMDVKKLLPGNIWDIEIQRNLRRAEIIIVFLSNNSVNKRGYIQKEIKTVLEYVKEKLSDDIYIIPVKLDFDVSIPEQLRSIQTLDLYENESLSQLKSALQAQAEILGLSILPSSTALDDIVISRKIFSERWEGLPGYEVSFNVPILYSTKFQNINEITKIIEAKYISQLQDHRKGKLDQSQTTFSWFQSSLLRTHTFDAHFDYVYNKNYIISIVYSVSWYGAGAAHPNYHFDTYNFILDPLIEIENIDFLFDKPDDAFPKLCEFVRKELLMITVVDAESEPKDNGQKLLEKEWVESGTDSWETLNSFAFSEKGLNIYFPPYQVGSYACGSHIITVPYQFIIDELKPDITHALSIEHLRYHLPHTGLSLPDLNP